MSESNNIFKKIKFDNGDIYIGEYDVKTDTRNGYGAYIWNNGNYYEGDFSRDKRTGKGIFIIGGIYYAGDFIEGKMTGIGKLWTKKQAKFVTGKFTDGVPENKFKSDSNYLEKNLSDDLSNFFKSQSKGIDFLNNIISDILGKMPEINSENSNPLLRNIAVDYKWTIFVYEKSNVHFLSCLKKQVLIKPSVKISLESIFSYISPKMINEISQSELNNYIIENVNSQLITSKQFFIESLQENIDIKTDLPLIEIRQGKDVYENLLNIDGYHPIVVHNIYVENIGEIREDIRVLFMGLGLIEQSIKKRSVNDKGTYWKLTEKGNNMMVELKMKKMM